jgi:adenylate kinase family enzyme
MRVMIVGSAGAGKSTLARALARRTGLPLVHLDALYWQPGWVETPRPRWREVQREALAGERWIADGNYGGTLERLALADVVVLLEYSRWICLWGSCAASGAIGARLGPTWLRVARSVSMSTS